MDVDLFKQGIFSLPTRRFGALSQIMIQELYGFDEPKNNFHDLFDPLQNQRIEVKFSIARSCWSRTVVKDSVMACIQEAVIGNEIVPYKNWQNYRFDCNMNQVKPSEFEVLYYGLFFEDEILIFRINSDEIGDQIQYSGKQHKGNVGEGQFHINNRTLPIHMEHYLSRPISYKLLMAVAEAAGKPRSSSQKARPRKSA